MRVSETAGVRTVVSSVVVTVSVVEGFSSTATQPERVNKTAVARSTERKFIGFEAYFFSVVVVVVVFFSITGAAGATLRTITLDATI
jgi:hypothetical protein